MQAITASPSPPVPQPAPQPQAAAGTGITFHDVVSALNPLQYLPVIGTIYRAVTGDQIPEVLRRIGSLAVSTLLGGPVGAMTNIAMLIGEKATGIDLDHIGQSLVGGKTPASPEPATPPTNPPVPAPAPGPAVAETAPQSWSNTQLAAYGVRSGPGGTLHRGDTQGADVLNGLELLRLHGAQTAYGRTASLAG